MALSAAEPVMRLQPARYLRYLLSFCLFMGVWYGVSAVVSARVVPAPPQVVGAFVVSVQDGYVWSDSRVTFGRILVAFFLALIIGIVVGITLGRVRWIQAIFGSWVTVAAAIPSVLYVVVIYLAVGFNDTAAVLGAALIVVPPVTFNIWQGTKSLNPELTEMARAYGVPRVTVVRRVFLPQTTPFLFAAARQGLALTWRIMIFVELMGRSSGVGFRINVSYQLFDMERALAAALLPIVVMLLIEFLFLRRLEGYLFRWRREEAR